MAWLADFRKVVFRCARFVTYDDSKLAELRVLISLRPLSLVSMLKYYPIDSLVHFIVFVLFLAGTWFIWYAWLLCSRYFSLNLSIYP